MKSESNRDHSNALSSDSSSLVESHRQTNSSSHQETRQAHDRQVSGIFGFSPQLHGSVVDVGPVECCWVLVALYILQRVYSQSRLTSIYGLKMPYISTFNIFQLVLVSPPLRGGVGGVKTEIFHFRGGLPPHT